MGVRWRDAEHTDVLVRSFSKDNANAAEIVSNQQLRNFLVHKNITDNTEDASQKTQNKYTISHQTKIEPFRLNKPQFIHKHYSIKN